MEEVEVAMMGVPARRVDPPDDSEESGGGWGGWGGWGSKLGSSIATTVSKVTRDVYDATKDEAGYLSGTVTTQLGGVTAAAKSAAKTVKVSHLSELARNTAQSVIEVARADELLAEDDEDLEPSPPLVTRPMAVSDMGAMASDLGQQDRHGLEELTEAEGLQMEVHRLEDMLERSERENRKLHAQLLHLKETHEEEIKAQSRAHVSETARLRAVIAQLQQEASAAAATASATPAVAAAAPASPPALTSPPAAAAPSQTSEPAAVGPSPYEAAKVSTPAPSNQTVPPQSQPEASPAPKIAPISSAIPTTPSAADDRDQSEASSPSPEGVLSGSESEISAPRQNTGDLAAELEELDGWVDALGDE